MSTFSYFVGIPCLLGAGHTKEAIESVVHHPDTFVLLIDNGAEQVVKDVLGEYEEFDNVLVIHNRENVYVNPAWNILIEHFLKSHSDYLMIMNSDLILHSAWKEVLNRELTLMPEIIPVPVISNDRNILNHTVHAGPLLEEVFEGTPGVLIVLNKKMASIIYPIPESIRVWFGDLFIYSVLRKLGYQTIIIHNLFTYHSGSQNVSKVPGIAEIIEEDKKAWQLIEKTI